MFEHKYMKCTRYKFGKLEKIRLLDISVTLNVLTLLSCLKLYYLTILTSLWRSKILRHEQCFKNLCLWTVRVICSMKDIVPVYGENGPFEKLNQTVTCIL